MTKDNIPDEVEENKLYKRARRMLAVEEYKHSRIANNQPDWVCNDCGTLYGDGKGRLATFHEDICDVCGELKDCTEPRDFGYLDRNWYSHERIGR